MNMSSGEQVSRIWALDTDTGKLRVHVVGTSSALDRVCSRIAKESPDRANPNTLFAWLVPALVNDGIILADRLDTPIPDRPRDLVARLKEIRKLADAPRAFKHIIALFDVAGATEINELIASADLVWVREYVASVLKDLDEFSHSGTDQLKAVLEPHAAYSLLPARD